MSNQQQNFNRGQQLTAEWVNWVTQSLERNKILAGSGIAVSDTIGGVVIRNTREFDEFSPDDIPDNCICMDLHSASRPPDELVSTYGKWMTITGQVSDDDSVNWSPNMHTDDINLIGNNFQISDLYGGTFPLLSSTVYEPYEIKILADMEIFVTMDMVVYHFPSVETLASEWLRQYSIVPYILRNSEWYQIINLASYVDDQPWRVSNGYGLGVHEERRFNWSRSAPLRLKKDDKLRFLSNREIIYNHDSLTLPTENVGPLDLFYLHVSFIPTVLDSFWKDDAQFFDYFPDPFPGTSPNPT